MGEIIENIISWIIIITFVVIFILLSYNIDQKNYIKESDGKYKIVEIATYGKGSLNIKVIYIKDNKIFSEFIKDTYIDEDVDRLVGSYIYFNNGKKTIKSK